MKTPEPYLLEIGRRLQTPGYTGGCEEPDVIDAAASLFDSPGGLIGIVTAAGALYVAGPGALIPAFVAAGVHLPATQTMQTVQVHVQDATSIARAWTGLDAVVSGPGLTKGGRPDTLTAGAVALAATHTGGTGPHFVWLGAYGSGRSAQTGGPALRLMLKPALGSEVVDEAAAHDIVLRAGATVFHAGPLTNGPLSATRRTVALEDAPHRLLPRTVSRATVAAAMLDEAENPRYSGHIVLPLP